MPRRRGSAAIEFALVLPVLVVIIVGIFEYGWFFLQESMVTNVLYEALRAGSFQSPATDTEESYECAACQATTAGAAVTSLARLGFAVAEEAVTPSITAIDGTCALVLEPRIAHTGLVGLIPVPETYTIRLVAYAQNLSGC